MEGKFHSRCYRNKLSSCNPGLWMWWKLLKMLCGFVPAVLAVLLIVGFVFFSKFRQYHADFLMVDQGQLQKCEELLELPEKPPAGEQHPVWVLMSGIEGFDMKRADECLEKLLDKRYDTIGVLKLVTKQDLVEDAGILPGDALRVVAAAKNYVSRKELDNAVHETMIGAGLGDVEVTERGGLDVAPFDPRQFTVEHDGTSEQGEGSGTQAAQEQGPTSVTKPHGKDIVVDEQQYEGSDSGSPLKCRAGGSDGGEKERVGAKKKRKRCSKCPGGGSNAKTKGESGGWKKRENWSDEETLRLLKAVPQKQDSGVMDKFCVSAASWESIAEAVPGRTEDQCRRRMDTLKKSYTAIKDHCAKLGIEFSELTEDFGVMRGMPKLATHFERRWYNYVRDYCPPRSFRKTRNQGGGSPLENGVNSVPCATVSGLESGNPEEESGNVVIAHDQGKENQASIEAQTRPHQAQHRRRRSQQEQVEAPDGPPPASDEAQHALQEDLQGQRAAEDGLPCPGDSPQDNTVYAPPTDFENDPYVGLINFLESPPSAGIFADIDFETLQRIVGGPQ